MGTLQSVSGKNKMNLKMTDQSECKLCRICEKKCPMGLNIIDNIDNGILKIRTVLNVIMCKSLS
jgi:ferredoxin